MYGVRNSDNKALAIYRVSKDTALTVRKSTMLFDQVSPIKKRYKLRAFLQKSLAGTGIAL